MPQFGRANGPAPGRGRPQVSVPTGSKFGSMTSEATGVKNVRVWLLRVQRPDTGVKLFTGRVGAARPSVADGAALPDAGRPRQATTPVRGIAYLPAANNVVHHSAGIAFVLLSAAEGQFVNGAEYEHVVAIEVDASPRILMAYGVVVILGISVGLGVRVVGQKLQSVREAFSSLTSNAL